MTADLAAQVEKILAGTGCTLAGFGPDSVAVMGDARFYGPSVCISVPPWIDMEQVGRLSSRITNEVKGVSRVLVEVSLTA